ncbi:Protein of unknown function [Pyronema omphalodes CBS 100304]|uniref:Uncharacterized protein n=1 Tax=Pyronema omphalodes (strain CBS 100304) TaxID=1076935 RepID=U4L4S8_PYROM|nr:Protein of unknown function [Pyronema omphalodes CBS 100304]
MIAILENYEITLIFLSFVFFPQLPEDSFDFRFSEFQLLGFWKII